MKKRTVTIETGTVLRASFRLPTMGGARLGQTEIEVESRDLEAVLQQKIIPLPEDPRFDKRFLVGLTLLDRTITTDEDGVVLVHEENPLHYYVLVAHDGRVGEYMRNVTGRSWSRFEEKNGVALDKIRVAERQAQAA